MPRLVALLLAVLATSPALPQDAIVPEAVERGVFSAFERGEYRQALELIEQFLEVSPRNPDMLYNAACAHARLGELDESAGYLGRAVEAGFSQFDHMARDPDMEPMRGHAIYQAIIEAARRVEQRAGETALEQWRTSYGTERYRYEHDQKHNLAYATALDETSHREMRRMLERQADQMIAAFFGAAPQYVTLVAVPAPEDAAVLFGDQENVGGIYQHARRRLVARDIGGSLRHEFFHLMHYGHMERLGKAHRLWVQEGMASLYEEYEVAPDGTFQFLPNWRHNIVRRRAEVGRLMSWEELFALSAEQFMARSGALYAQTRSMFEFVAERGLLERWYRAYVEHFDEDPGGRAAFEAAFDAPLEEVEQRWQSWVAARPEVDLELDHDDGLLGVECGPPRNDGVLVTAVMPGSAAALARMRRGDVIVAIDERAIRSMSELQSAIAARRPGDRVLVRIRRGEGYLSLPVTLRPLEPTRLHSR